MTHVFGGEEEQRAGPLDGEWIIDEMTTIHWVSVQNMPTTYPFGCGTSSRPGL